MSCADPRCQAFGAHGLLDSCVWNVRRLPEQWAPYLASELRAVNQSAANRLHHELRHLWPAFVYKKGCAFEMLMLELAVRKLGLYHSRKAPWRRATRNALHSFWSPERGNFELPNAQKVGPSWGAGAISH